jgi:hypothetical protein
MCLLLLSSCAHFRVPSVAAFQFAVSNVASAPINLQERGRVGGMTTESLALPSAAAFGERSLSEVRMLHGHDQLLRACAIRYVQGVPLPEAVATKARCVTGVGTASHRLA